MNKEKAIQLGDNAMNRDPRQATYGMFSGGSFVLDSTRVFMWFEAIQELMYFIKNSEPLIFDLDAEDIKKYEVEINPILEKVYKDGLTSELKNKINEISSNFMVIEWWGNFSELVDFKTEFSRNIIEKFFDQLDEEPKSVSHQHLDDFIEFIKSYGY
jgi:hypothetical protein